MSTPKVVKARALIAWFDPERGAQILAGQRIARVQPAHRERAERAIKALRSRPSLVTPPSVIKPLAPTLDGYLSEFRSGSQVQEILRAGFEPVLVNLSGVHALQQVVVVDAAKERVQGLAAHQFTELAKICLPIPGKPHIAAQYDENAHAWVLSSPNQNLRIVGNWGAPTPEGHVVFGFAVNVVPSFVQILKLGPRYYLRDGYHRCIGLLMQGISSVPAIYKEIKSPEQLALTPDLLPSQVVLSENAPLLSDYLDSELSADCEVPQPIKNILVQGLQFRSFAMQST